VRGDGTRNRGQRSGAIFCARKAREEVKQKKEKKPRNAVGECVVKGFGAERGGEGKKQNHVLE